jgi:hypothetical protein
MANINKKIVLSCRIEPYLKEELAYEAIMQDEVLSSYIESILIDRDDKIFLEAEVDSNAGIMTALLNRIEELKEENTELRECRKDFDDTPKYTSNELELETQVKQLEKEYLNLSQRFKDLMTERDALLKAGSTGLPDWLSTECYNQIVAQLKQLKRRHSQYSAEDLLLSAVTVTVENERNSVVSYTLTDYWERNPHFINLK